MHYYSFAQLASSDALSLSVSLGQDLAEKSLAPKLDSYSQPQQYQQKCYTRERMGYTGIPLERLVNLDQLDVNFWKINVFWHLSSKQYTKTHSFISEDFALEVL